MQVEIVRNQRHEKHDSVATAGDVWARVRASRERLLMSLPPAPKFSPPPIEVAIAPIEIEELRKPQIEWTGSLWAGDLCDLIQAAYPPRYVGGFASIKDILAAVSEASRVRVADLISARRTADIVLPRQVAMAIAKRLTLKSLPEIGRRFGGRDHTTVLHACRKMEPLIEALAARLPAGASLETWVSAALDLAPSMNLMTAYRRRKNQSEAGA